MKSFTTLENLYKSLTQNADSANVTLGDQLINDGNRIILGKSPWWFMEKTSIQSTVASQQFYEMPADFSKLDSVTVTIGSTIYVPKEAPSRQFWDRLNQTTSITSDIPEYYFIFGTQLGFYPKPSSTTSNAITYVYKRNIKDLSIADYTTGTVVSIASGGTAVVGSGTTWTASMVGRFIRITDSDTVNKGDGQWYEIGTYTSATSIGLLKPYQGTAIAAGAAAYTIGQMPPYPETYHMLPVYYAVAEYWLQKGSEKSNTSRAIAYMQKFNDGIKEMKADAGQKSISVVLDSGERYVSENPNLYVRL